jgi:hypothetical protein
MVQSVDDLEDDMPLVVPINAPTREEAKRKAEAEHNPYALGPWVISVDPAAEYED